MVLAIARLAICDSDGTLSVDPEVSCTDPFLIPLVLFGAGAVSVSTLHLAGNAAKVRGDIVSTMVEEAGVAFVTFLFPLLRGGGVRRQYHRGFLRKHWSGVALHSAPDRLENYPLPGTRQITSRMFLHALAVCSSSNLIYSGQAGDGIGGPTLLSS